MKDDAANFNATQRNGMHFHQSLEMGSLHQYRSYVEIEMGNGEEEMEGLTCGLMKLEVVRGLDQEEMDRCKCMRRYRKIDVPRD